MNRYQKAFNQTKLNNEAAFIPFAVAGDPDIDKNEEIFKAYIDGGADILEIGNPFSDPVADGPVNQRAGMRAIESGLNPSRFFSLIKKLRNYTDMPFGLLLYANIIYNIGTELFCKKAAAAGIDSLLVADMPPEESTELAKAMKRYGLGRVFIVTELTPIERMKYICNQVDSFVYVVSRLGATGTGSAPSKHLKETLSKIKNVSDKPCAVGFGISTPLHVQSVKQCGAEGIIVGSALSSIIEQNHSNKNFISNLKKTIRSYKDATKHL